MTINILTCFRGLYGLNLIFVYYLTFRGAYIQKEICVTERGAYIREGLIFGILRYGLLRVVRIFHDSRSGLDNQHYAYQIFVKSSLRSGPDSVFFGSIHQRDLKVGQCLDVDEII